MIEDLSQRELANLQDEVGQVRNHAEVHLENHGERLRCLEMANGALRRELERLNKTVSVLFIAMAMTMLATLIALWMGHEVRDDVLALRGQAADLVAWLTKLTAEVRGIGG